MSRRINFSPRDRNEEALTLFDELGVDVWLQVEPGDAPVDELFHAILERYAHHPCVIGVGVDVEWLESDGTPEGRAVTDEEAAAWVAEAREHGPDLQVFLKHWESTKMPPLYRDGLVLVDDSQQFESLEHLVAEFGAWGEAFAPSPVGFQYGYPADSVWWEQLDDPPGGHRRGSPGGSAEHERAVLGGLHRDAGLPAGRGRTSLPARAGAWTRLARGRRGRRGDPS